MSEEDDYQALILAAFEVGKKEEEALQRYLESGASDDPETAETLVATFSKALQKRADAVLVSGFAVAIYSDAKGHL
jgi:hypothetical protein